MQQRPTQAAERARDSKADENPPIDMGAQPPEPERGSEEVRDGNRGNRKLGPDSHREERGEHTPNPKPDDGSNRPRSHRCRKKN
jgi:hypothetical protein